MKTPFLNRKGFTLIELLIVIAILATLGGISTPVYMSMTENAKKTAARKVCTDIVEGVTRFGQDNNGMMPYDEKEVQPDDEDQLYLTTTDGEDGHMIAILTNREEDEDNRINTTRDTYLKAQEQEARKDGLFVEDSGALHFYDPWGKPYYVVMCAEEEGCLDPFTEKKHIRNQHCLVYSTGPDGEGIAPAHSGRPKTTKKKGSKKVAAPTEEEAEAIEDNVYSWKKKNK